MYGAEVWGELVNQIHRNKLLSLQRSILIIVSKAYRTVSTDALPVITGILPIDLKARERSQIYQWNYNVTQILTGHGDFYNKLASFKLHDRVTCECGEIDEVEHVVLNCPLYDDIRINYLESAIVQNWRTNLNFLTNKENIKQFTEFAKLTLKRRKKLRECELTQ
ncbi:hypothetical protein J437_LFUL013293 [Ladona fulva]|uniref:Reverse transcriptase n=1 Tax=Ladona fulva TaxID=123851 RepID=A0A8K0KDR8_LADFU|nr:hypothetical protein J437_LFUL013293 [Ladona fulva]